MLNTQKHCKGEVAVQEYTPQQMLVCSINRRQSCGKTPLWAAHLSRHLALNLWEQINLGGSSAKATDWLERRQTSDPGSTNIKHGLAFELHSTQAEILSLLAGLQDTTHLVLCQHTMTFYSEIQQNGICCCNGQISALAKLGLDFRLSGQTISTKIQTVRT